MERGRGIRWHLLQVQLIAIVPIGVFAAALLYFHWQVQEHERQRAQMETVRLLAAAVDNALDSTIERLAIFARLWSSGALNEQTIHAPAREALGSNPDWSSIAAYDAVGRGVFRTDVPSGRPLSTEPPADVWKPVFAERRAVVSDVLPASRGEPPTVAVGVPVVRDGAVAYVLVANLNLVWYDRLTQKQGQPEDAVAGLIDRNLKFIARSFEGPARRGADPLAEYVADLKVRREGSARYRNLNGTDVFNSWTATRHGWTAAFATPTAPIDEALWHHLVMLGFVWAAAVAVGMVYALSKGRVIAASLESLEAQAHRLSAGGRFEDLPDSRVEEVDRALVALERASELLQTTTRERDRAFETEHEARAAAETANQAKDEFLAMLSHELRNPLAAIMTATTIVKSERRSAEQLEFATGVIDRQSHNLKRLIDDLLDVARALTGKILLERRPLELATVARRVVATLRSADQLEDRRVTLDTQAVWIDGDQTRVEQMLSNLLVNAVRYSAPGGRIGVHIARENSEAVLRVDDDGQGIAAEDLPRVFELFFQAPSASNRAAGGLGIGLTLLRRLARLHGGDVTAHSEGRGKGATFTVRLPAIAAPPHAGQGGEVSRGGQGISLERG